MALKGLGEPLNDQFGQTVLARRIRHDTLRCEQGGHLRQKQRQEPCPIAPPLGGLDGVFVVLGPFDIRIGRRRLVPIVPGISGAGIDLPLFQLALIP